MAEYPLYEIRRRNLASRLTEAGAKVDLATKLGITGSQISHWLRQPGERGARTIKEESAREIEEALRMPVGSLDVDDTPSKRRRGAIQLVTPNTPAPAPAPPEAKPRNGTPVNQHELMAKTVRAVLLEVQDMKGKPMIDKVADIVALAFEHATDHGDLDESHVHTLVKLMT